MSNLTEMQKEELIKNGYIKEDLYDISDWFTRTFSKMLLDMASDLHGYPDTFNSSDEWKSTLEKMAFYLTESSEEYCQKINKYEKKVKKANKVFEDTFGPFGEKLNNDGGNQWHLYTEDLNHPENVELDKKWLAEENKLDAYRDECLDKFMELFKEHFRDLWD